MMDKIYIMELIMKVMEVKKYIMEQKVNIRAGLCEFRGVYSINCVRKGKIIIFTL